MRAVATSIILSSLLSSVFAVIGQEPCVAFTSAGGGFPIAGNGASPQIWTDPTDSNSVFRVVEDFITDIKSVTGTELKVSNYTSSSTVKGTPIIVGTLGTPMMNAVVKASKMDVSAVEGQWETFLAQEVSNPMPGVAKAFVVAGSDRRG